MIKKLLIFFYNNDSFKQKIFNTKKNSEYIRFLIKKYNVNNLDLLINKKLYKKLKNNYINNDNKFNKYILSLLIRNQTFRSGENLFVLNLKKLLKKNIFLNFECFESIFNYY